MAYRQVKLVVIFGANGTGKSYLMRTFLPIRQRNLILPANRSDGAKSWKGIPEIKAEIRFRTDPRDPKGKRQVPFYVIPGLRTFTGNRVLYVEGSDDERRGMFNAVIHPTRGFRDGGLFLDDYKSYVENQGLITGELRTFFGNRRHHMVDIYMATWQFQDCNADIMGFRPLFLIGYVERPPNRSVHDKVPDYEGLVRTWQRAREMNLKLPELERHIFLRFPKEQQLKPETGRLKAEKPAAP